MGSFLLADKLTEKFLLKQQNKCQLERPFPILNYEIPSILLLL